MLRNLSRFGCLLCLTAWALATDAADKSQPALTVFAASSLTNALQDIGDAFTRERGRPVRLSFAASWTLAKQIDSGADADVFISANRDWMDYLAAHRSQG
jgi:molybdate transport system substrate-binding protein